MKRAQAGVMERFNHYEQLASLSYETENRGEQS